MTGREQVRVVVKGCSHRISYAGDIEVYRVVQRKWRWVKLAEPSDAVLAAFRARGIVVEHAHGTAA